VSCPGRSLPPGKTWYPLYRRLGRPQGRSGQVQKILPPTGIQPPDRPDRSHFLYKGCTKIQMSSSAAEGLIPLFRHFTTVPMNQNETMWQVSLYFTENKLSCFYTLGNYFYYCHSVSSSIKQTIYTVNGLESS
jgi:hypothetical protein